MHCQHVLTIQQKYHDLYCVQKCSIYVQEFAYNIINIPQTWSTLWIDLEYTFRISCKLLPTQQHWGTPQLVYRRLKLFFSYMLCCCCLPCHWLLKNFWPFGNRLRSTHCREFLFMKLQQTPLLRQNYSIITSSLVCSFIS